MYDLEKMTLRDMSECGLALRDLGNKANSMEDAGNNIIQYLYENLISKKSGANSCVLIRFFKTHPYGELTAELQEYARGLLGNNLFDHSLKCLTLLATAGELPEWNSRHQSSRHQVFPLGSEEAIARAPMIFQLIQQLGLNPGTVVKPDPYFFTDLEQRMYNVFYVPDALDSPYIPSQTSFVIPFKVKSVVGFGGLLPSGNMFAIVMFLKVTIPRVTIDLLRPLALNVKMAILPFDNERIFRDQSQPVINKKITALINRHKTFRGLHSKISTLTQLLDVFEQSTITQSDRLEQAITDLQKTIDELAKEVTRRKHAEEEISKANEELEIRVEERTTALKETLNELQRTQTQLIQSEKMSSLGQMVAGVAHEINNPVTFIQSNLVYVKQYTEDLLRLVQLYQQYYPNSPQTIQEEIKAIELDFVVEDMTKILNSMNIGTERIQEIVKSLRNFSRLDEAELKKVDIHEGIDSTLMILEHRLQATSEYQKINVIKEYGQLPLVECYPSQLNQVFINIIANAIDALEESFVIRHTLRESFQGEASSLVNNLRQMTNDKKQMTAQIHIRTELLDDEWVAITITDNGLGMNEQVRAKLFDPFFTTKPVGKGTGIGLSISYQIIVEKHGGQLSCLSALGQGAFFLIKIPIQQQ